MKLWGGRFTKQADLLVDEFNASISFDYKLASFDIQGSLAHIKMLGKCQLVDDESVTLITEGLHTLHEKIQAGEFSWQLADEDVHMNIERALHELIGETAGKLHTGRSRNDQVALDLHLYLRQHILQTIENLCQLNSILLRLANTHIDIIMPGYTHLQHAEPIRFSQHILAYFNMFARDATRLLENFSRTNVCPLGAGALAGSGVAIDRLYVAEQLQFDAIYSNSVDAVSDRDFVVEFLSNAALIMMHLSKFSEEIILWNSHEFNFISLDDAFCTGSSMMPQKKNPDVAELTRGKTGRVYGALLGLLTVLKGLPLAYNKDLQEDKEGLFDVVNTLAKCLPIFSAMLQTMQLHPTVMQQAADSNYANSTQLANYLVKQGLPFRQAHVITGKLVLHCIDHQVLLSELPLAMYQTFAPHIDQEIYQHLSLTTVVDAHAAVGGTAYARVQEQCELAELTLQHLQTQLATKRHNCKL
jgi:argininosuccinate lyase